MGLLSPVGCGALIGLDEYTTAEDSDLGYGGGDGSGGATSDSGGRSGGGGSPDNSGGTDGSGGNTGGSGGAPTPNSCVHDSDCGDGLSCTSDVCKDGVCENAITCTPSTDICERVECRASGCTTIDLNSRTNLVHATLGNGSFENITIETRGSSRWEWADDWLENSRQGNAGELQTQLTYGCTNTCTFANGGTRAYHLERLAWLGGLTSWQDSLRKIVELPSGAAKLRIRAHTNFQTNETTTSQVFDTYAVKLLSATRAELAVFKEGSNLDAKKTGIQWQVDGLDEELDVSGWAGDTVQIEFSSRNDAAKEIGSGVYTNATTDFGFDEILLQLTVCQ